MPMLYKIRGFTPTDSAITLYTHKLWHRRYVLNREVQYWLGETLASCYSGRLLQGHFMQNYYIDGEIADSSSIQ